MSENKFSLNENEWTLNINGISFTFTRNDLERLRDLICDKIGKKEKEWLYSVNWKHSYENPKFIYEYK